MKSYSRGDVILVRYPFSDLSSAKVRPAVIVGAAPESRDVFLVPLTSKIEHLLTGEFVLVDWERCGLNVPSAVKRGVYTIQNNLIIKSVGRLSKRDLQELETSLKAWLALNN